jgi:hypothetical protein
MQHVDLPAAAWVPFVHQHSDRAASEVTQGISEEIDALDRSRLTTRRA